ncbi:hypothetical protein AT15_09645 [Kosmotoga arenicorallina S304]|uniref:NADH dehydrogenase n=1 Tax=Kosmotoga arenicorallina S304 TaxID=1453497 RepID=A0A176K1D1_9BACT|nr:complex I subunit 1 family protein [Kosmotoga arenicorallina]OAA30683.1 hypothetical protein AT15_09645 [Kosmotoga arenicorallina S304]
MIAIYTLLFPGLVFTAFCGMIAWWIERKLSALFQHRVGPPWYQNFIDFFKLLGKESIVPADSAGIMYSISPLIAFASVVAFATILGSAVFLKLEIAGDLILLLYLSSLVSTGIFLGASASANVYAAIGASREIKMLLADELVFVMVVLVPVVKSGFSFRLEAVLNTSAITSLSGVIAYILGLMCIQAKLALQPFDLPEAETELAGGVEIEYSGVLLGIWKLTKAMEFFIYPLFLSVLFFGIGKGLVGILLSVLFYLITLIILVIMKNVNPRVTIDKMLNFFWKVLSPLALIALVLALFGG